MIDPAKTLAALRAAVGVLAIAKGVAFAILGVSGVVVGGWMLAAFAVALGFRARRFAVALVVIGGGLFATGHHSNLFFLLLLLLILFAASDCERDYAVWPGTPGPIGVDAPLFLMRCQLSIVYGFAGLAKINASWMGGAALGFFLERAMWDPPSAVEPLLPVIALLVIAFELGLATAMWIPGLRRAAVLAAVGLHAGMLPVAVSWLDAFELLIFAGLMGCLFVTFFTGPLAPLGGRPYPAGPTVRSDRPAAAGS